MNKNYFIYVIIMALVTYFIRMFPMALIRNKIQNKFIKSFLFYIPYAVLGAMTFPAILFSTNFILSAAIGCTIAIILAFFNKSLFTVALFSCVGVYITEFIIQTFFNSLI